MTYKVILNSTEYTIPYEFMEEIWYCHKEKKRYVVSRCRVTGVWATNIVGITLDNNCHISEDEFDRIFTNKNAAIDWCLKQNQRATVKVYD